MRKLYESGRSMLEMLAILILLALLTLAGLWGFQQAVLSSRVNTMTKDLSNAVSERRYLNAQGGNTKPHKITTKVGSTVMTIKNRTNEQDFFVAIQTKNDTALCEEMKKYNVFKPKGYGKNEETGTFTENFKNINCAGIDSLDFYFDNYGAESDGGGHGSDPLHNDCDGVSSTKHCCDNEYDRNGCLIKEKEQCAPTHKCVGCTCTARETCPDDYSDVKCWPGQDDNPITLENGKECHKCSGTPLENCYVNYEEGTCPNTKIIKDYIVLKNGKECSLCESCPEGKKPDSEQKVCVDCSDDSTCPGGCPSDKPYWDEVHKKCIKLEDKKNCPSDYKEGNCSSDEIILKKSTLKNKKVCSKCSKCSAGKKPDSDQKTCIDCDATMTCSSCPVDKPYWDETKKECSKCQTGYHSCGEVCCQGECNADKTYCANKCEILPTKIGASCTKKCGCGNDLACSDGKCLAECKKQEYKYVLNGTGTKCEPCPTAHKVSCATECTDISAPAGCCFSAVLDALDDCICAKSWTHSRKHKLGDFSGLKSGKYTVSVDNGMWHCGATYPSCTYSRGGGEKSCSCGTGLYIESNGVKTELTSKKTIYLNGETSMYLEDGTVSASIHNGDGCYDNCGQVALKFIKQGCTGKTACTDIARIFDEKTCSCVCNPKIYKERDGKCICKDEVIIPQYGIFAQTTQCYAIKEIARLGPYACDYDIYVKGHIDDTFLVKTTSGKTVCAPNNREHHMTDGILYTIPAKQSVIVYAKDVGCAIIAWERDYHGTGSRTPVAATMEIRKAKHSAGYCNGNI